MAIAPLAPLFLLPMHTYCMCSEKLVIADIIQPEIYDESNNTDRLLMYACTYACMYLFVCVCT